MDIGSAYHRCRGGPGGWWIIDEPELHFVRDTEVLVPDIAGWRRERMSSLPEDHCFEVVPDWVCEILSPTTQKKDRATKTKAYPRYGVAFLWLVDPPARIFGNLCLGRRAVDSNRLIPGPRRSFRCTLRGRHDRPQRPVAGY
jgi:Uma2 family endonuclease